MITSGKLIYNVNNNINNALIYQQKRFTKKGTASSQNWLQRQRNDIYVKQAHVDGYHSRAAYKLLQIFESGKYLQNIQKKRKEKIIRIVDLGSAPGSWSQAMISLLSTPSSPSSSSSSSSASPSSTSTQFEKYFTPVQNKTPFLIVAVDKQEMEVIKEVKFIKGDFTDQKIKEKIKEELPEGKADIVLSDMAPSASGDSSLDHILLIDLAEQALYFAISVLNINTGLFIAKISHGSSEVDFKKKVSKYFETVQMEKPSASRSDSREIYISARKLLTNKIIDTENDNEKNSNEKNIKKDLLANRY